ncbi:MAG TPA: carbonic anhydrase [Candidatus Baltobacteraceae bacterium]|jgi:carbonic anhydrase|nr:carbonic anhydrase [Candidatus Baltobacteraceae bacterium]
MPINRASFLSASLAAMGTAAVAEPALAAAPSGAAPAGGQTPQQLLDRLMAGNKRFVNSDFPMQNHVAEKREMLRDTQAPFAAILTCADSRVIPNFIFVQGLGDLFVTRVAGNYPDDLVTGSIEYAIEHLGSRVVMVLGHQNCGAIKAVYSATDEHQTMPPHLITIQRLIAPGIQSVVQTKGTIRAAIDANVRAAKEVLATSSPIIDSAVKSGKVLLVGAVYKLGTGEVALL